MKPTKAQRRVLEEMEEGVTLLRAEDRWRLLYRDGTSRLVTITALTLSDNGWIDSEVGYTWLITPAGREALREGQTK